MTHDEITSRLRETDPERLERLWAEADAVRRENVGDAVHLRGLIEISNCCARTCLYCGLRGPNAKLERYRMSDEEIVAAARQAEALGYGTVVIQSGEDDAFIGERVAGFVRRIKAETPLAVTLSLGERKPEELELWREAGADRYLLRFETSDRKLYNRIHPPREGRPSNRFALLRRLGELGYEVGSGVMVGIPGQTYDLLARDIEWFADLDLDMVGVGPFIAHPGTPLGAGPAAVASAPPGEQVPATEEMTYKVVALTRLACPRTNIPSTSALATVNLAHGREFGLCRGANVVMPNVTPARYRAMYEIYPGKACINESAGDCARCIRARIESLGRTIGTGRGDSPNLRRKLEGAATLRER